MKDKTVEENTLTILCHFGHSHDHNGNPNRRGQNPNEHVDQLSLDGCPKFQRPDWMAHSNVAVHAHHCKGEDACEHVVVVDGNDQLAQDFPKWPSVHEVFGTLEGQRAGG